MPARLLLGCAAALPPAGRPRVQALVDAVANREGAPVRPIGGDGDVLFGGFGFRYDERSDSLTVRVFISPASVKNTTPQGLANFRKVAAALNDPSIGGMFDRGGAQFILDEEREAYYLVRTLAVAAADTRTISASLERMQAVTGLWTTRWMFHVAMIVGGHQPPPDQPVTITDPGPAE